MTKVPVAKKEIDPDLPLRQQLVFDPTETGDPLTGEGRQPEDPSPEEIRRACKKILAKLSPTELDRRRVGPSYSSVSIPNIDLSEYAGRHAAYSE